MKTHHICAPLTLASVLSGCGGGGGVQPMPAAAPAPAPASYDSFTSAGTDKHVSMTGVLLSRTDRNGATGATSTAVKTFAGSTVTLAYNAANGSYTIRDNARAQTFAAADKQPGLQFVGPAFETYKAGTEANTHYLSLYKPAGDASHVALTYTTLGNWIQRDVTGAGTADVVVDSKSLWAVGGFATTAADMPRTGSATYQGFVQGNGSTGAAVTGQSRLIANFATGGLTADLFLNGVASSTLIVSGTGGITADSSRFSGSLAGGGYSGSFDGGFFGPAAAEMGFGFALGSDQGRIDGVAAGRK